MGLQAAVHLGHMPWALTKEEEEEEGTCIYTNILRKLYRTQYHFI
jgi:hypothetical protein